MFYILHNLFTFSRMYSISSHSRTHSHIHSRTHSRLRSRYTTSNMTKLATFFTSL